MASEILIKELLTSGWARSYCAYCHLTILKECCFFSPLFIFWLQLQQLMKCYQFFRSVEKTWYFFHFLKLARLICAIWMKAGYKSQGNYCLLLCCILILWEGASHIELTSAVGKLHFKHFKSIFFCCTAIGLAWQVVKEGRQVFWKLMLE